MPLEQLVISSVKDVDIYMKASLKNLIYNNPDFVEVLQSIHDHNSSLQDKDTMDQEKVRTLFKHFERKPITIRFRDSCRHIFSDVFENRGIEFRDLLEVHLPHTYNTVATHSHSAEAHAIVKELNEMFHLLLPGFDYGSGSNNGLK
mmetsp:Transcript_31354/g.33693  ORF Transcript_31354/g.33693 Transcript_31354/m.33693 type:complete len:146 (+) Transcript_31354:143-580(+)